MLLNILQYTGHPPRKNHLAPNDKSTKAEKPLYSDKSTYTSICPFDSYHTLEMKARSISTFIPKYLLNNEEDIDRQVLPLLG